MNLWIRTQDRKYLIPIKNVLKVDGLRICHEDRIIGTYSSNKRALKVFDEIISLLDIKVDINCSYQQADIFLKGLILANMSKVYIMPLD